MNKSPSHGVAFARLALLFLIAYAITQFAFTQIRNLTSITYSVDSLDQENGGYLERQSGTVGNAFEAVSSLVKAPMSLLYFDISILNARQAEISPTEKIPLSMNVEIEGVYNDAIKFGETRVVAEGIRGQDIPNLIVTRSFGNTEGISLASTTPSVGSFYNQTIWPTRASWFFIYFVAGIPLAYALLALINACYRFVRFGAPFTNEK